MIKNDSNNAFSFRSIELLVTGEAKKRHLIERKKNSRVCGVCTIAFAGLLSDDLALSNICLSTTFSYRKMIALCILRCRIRSHELSIIVSCRKKVV